MIFGRTRHGQTTAIARAQSHPAAQRIGLSLVSFVGIAGTLLLLWPAKSLEQTRELYLSDATPLFAINGLGTVEADYSTGRSDHGDALILSIAGEYFSKGLAVHAPSEIQYELPGRCSRFYARVGIDDEAGQKGSVVFEVWSGGQRVFVTPQMVGGSGAHSIDLDLRGQSDLLLKVLDAGDGTDNDRANWAEARIVCAEAWHPVAPSGLSAVAVQEGETNLGWTGPKGARGALVERCTGSGCSDFEHMSTVSPFTTHYTDMTTVARTTYTYRVCAVTQQPGTLCSEPVVATTPESAAVEIFPGTSIQTAVDSHPEGTVFVLTPGVHRMQSVMPKDGNTFVGRAGSVMNGSRVLTPVREGAYWIAGGQTQAGRVHGVCQAEHPRCRFPEDLFRNGVPLRHVAQKSELASGRWFFDYNADKIYMVDDPTGSVIESSVTSYAFGGNASRVTVTGLTIEKYATVAQHAAIGYAAPGFGWLVQDNDVRWNHGMGIRTSTNSRVLRNSVHSNGQLGVGGSGDNVVVEANEFSNNGGWAGFDFRWEAGATKFVATEGLEVRRNYSHQNAGAGLWTDIDNIDTLYEHNTVIGNGAGISHEISYKAEIRNNFLFMNARSTRAWVWGGQVQIQNSQNVEVYGNTIVVPPAGGMGIMLIQQARGSGKYGRYLTRDNHVHGNEVTYTGDWGMTGGAADADVELLFQGNNRFDRNMYRSPFGSAQHWAWNGSATNWDGFRRWHESQGSFVLSRRE